MIIGLTCASVGLLAIALVAAVIARRVRQSKNNNKMDLAETSGPRTQEDKTGLSQADSLASSSNSETSKA